MLACGGFEANPEWRTRYLGPGWDLAKVRGTRFNTGDGIRMATRDRRLDARQLVGLPRRAVGDERAGIRRPRGRRPVPEALLSVLRAGQRHRQALRRRGRRLPQLHLCEIRPRGAGAAGPVRLAGLRRQGQAPAARRVPHPPDHQGDRRHARGIRAEARRRERRAVPQDHRRVQRGGEARTCRSIPTSRTAAAPTGSRSTRATGRTRSIRRRTRATR